MTDTLIVSRTLGVNALAALGATDWLSYMMISIIQALAQGFAIMLAQDFGAQDHEHLHEALAHSIMLSVILTAITTVLSVTFTSFLLEILGTKQELMSMSTTYLRIIYGGLPAVLLLNFGSSVLRAFGDSKTPLFAVGVSATVNIVLDLLFVRVFSFGVAGAASATIIAQLLAGIYCMYVIANLDFIHLEKQHFHQVEHLNKDLLKLAWPMMAQNLVISLGGMVVQSQVNQYSLSFIAGYAATNKLYGMLEMAATAYGFAMVTYIGQNYGARLYQRIKDGLRSSVIIALITSMTIAVFMILIGKPLLSLFLTGDATEVAEALYYAYRFLVIMSVPLPILYILYITRSFLQGIGNTFVPMVSGIGECIARIFISVVIGMKIGSDSVLLAEPGAWFVAMVILSWSVYQEIRKMPASESLKNKIIN